MLSVAATAEIFIYEGKYEGIQVGVSSKNQVVNLKGKPIRKSVVLSDETFHYDGFQIRFDRNTVSTISIVNPEYSDPNGISVGFSQIVLEAVLKSEVVKDTLVDKNKGIIYWVENGVVSKIVIAYKLKLNG